MKKGILRFAGIVSIAALLCAGCGDDNDVVKVDPNKTYRLMVAISNGTLPVDDGYTRLNIENDKKFYDYGEEVTIKFSTTEHFYSIGEWSVSPRENGISSDGALIGPLSNEETGRLKERKEASLTVRMKGDTKVIAIMRQTRRLLDVTVEPANGGVVEVEMASGEQHRYEVAGSWGFIIGDTATLKAIANPGYMFVRWSGELTSANETEKIIIGDVSGFIDIRPLFALTGAH